MGRNFSRFIASSMARLGRPKRPRFGGRSGIIPLRNRLKKHQPSKSVFPSRLRRSRKSAQMPDSSYLGLWPPLSNERIFSPTKMNSRLVARRPSGRVPTRCPLNLSTFTALELRNNRWETCSGCKKCAAPGPGGGNNRESVPSFPRFVTRSSSFSLFRLPLL